MANSTCPATYGADNPHVMPKKIVGPLMSVRPLRSLRMFV